MIEPDSPLDRLQNAIRDFVNDEAEEAVLVDNALLVWEEVRVEADGSVNRRIQYSVPTDNFTLSGSLGLLEAVGTFLRRDILGAEGGGNTYQEADGQ